MIQANIKFSFPDKKNRALLITSPSKGEGKTKAAANLAISMAQQKEKVLLIDANLRNPSLHSIFNIENTIGLSDILLGRAAFYEAIHHTEIGRLDIVPSGSVQTNPVELLSSSLMSEILKTSLKTYDFILIDSNAVLELTDTKLLANQCDGVVLIIQNGKTPASKAIEAKKVLEFVKARLLGVIVNE